MNSWARVVCVLIMSCVAEACACTNVQRDASRHCRHYVIVLFHVVTCSTDGRTSVSGVFIVSFVSSARDHEKVT